MMQFIVIAYDGKDEEAPQRRLAARESHIALGDKMRDEGSLLYAVAILDDDGGMIGSVMVVQFASTQELEAWLGEEPYVRGDVWKKIEMLPARVGPSFSKQT
jgi:uncharacterized protein YciI